MRVSSVQMSSNSPSFNGVVSVKNLKTKKTQVYRVSSKTDEILADAYHKIQKSANIDQGIANIKRYVFAIYSHTKDEFLNTLPMVMKEEAPVVDISSKASYSIYQGGVTYSELKTNGFEIIHDMTK